MSEIAPGEGTELIVIGSTMPGEAAPKDAPNPGVPSRASGVIMGGGANIMASWLTPPDHSPAEIAASNTCSSKTTSAYWR